MLGGMDDADPQLLETVALFAGTDAVVRAEAIAAGRLHDVAPGEVLFHQGAEAHGFHVLLDGRVKVTQLTAEGEQVLARYVGPGEMFGCIALFGETHYPGSAEAVLASRSLSWDGPITTTLMERHPRIALNALHTLATRVHELQSRFQELATERVERRIAHAVLRLAHDAGVKVAEGVRVDFPLSRQDLAEMTGTTLFTVSRVLRAWEKAGTVDVGRQVLVIRRPHALVAIANDL